MGTTYVQNKAKKTASVNTYISIPSYKYTGKKLIEQLGTRNFFLYSITFFQMREVFNGIIHYAANSPSFMIYTSVVLTCVTFFIVIFFSSVSLCYVNPRRKAER